MAESSPSFVELGVREEIVDALAPHGITAPFAIQELTLPIALKGSDLIGQARTGMGKTLGFGIPLLNRLAAGEVAKLDGTPRALVVVPTRELCLQVTADLHQAAALIEVPRTPRARKTKRPLSILAIYGGTSYDTQVETLVSGADVVVGTPGRLLDLAERGNLVLDKAEILVLDEADQMLDLGFLHDVERILQQVPEKRQTMLFSATMPPAILTLARTFLTKPLHVRAESATTASTHERTAQFVYRAHNLDKIEVLARILQARGRGATMVFTRTKRSAHSVTEELRSKGFKATSIHGDLGQQARERSLERFRSGKADVLVATDVAARGIDIDGVTHVINYQCPDDEKTYVHRIGRTGRAGRTGIAVTLVDWDDLFKWSMINKALGLGFDDPVETYSTSPHLYSDLDIPTDATGELRSTLSEPTTEDASRSDESGRRHRGRTRNQTNDDGHNRKPRRRRTRAGKVQDSTGEATPSQRRSRRRTRSRNTHDTED